MMKQFFENFRRSFGERKAQEPEDLDYDFGRGKENQREVAQRIIKSIIRVYAVSQEIRVKFSKDIKLSPEMKGVLVDSFAVYIFEDNKKSQLFKTLLIDLDDFGKDVRKDVLVLLHEIRHFNQHQFWLSSSPEQRMSFVGKHPLPPELERFRNEPEKMKRALAKFPIWKIHSFWIETFGDLDSPLERDAYEFANKHYKQAVYDNADEEDLKMLRGINRLDIAAE